MSEATLNLIIQIAPSVLWFGLVVVLLVVMRNHIAKVLDVLMWRLKSGSQVKLGAFEIGPIYITPQGDLAKGTSLIRAYKDDGTRHKERGEYYLPNRDLFLVHRLAPSNQPGQLYDIRIYLIPHKDATLAGVSKVEYYFGPHWRDTVFVSSHRANGFAVSTSAFGPFVCTAKIHFADGNTTTLWRYIDFEMGPVGTV